MNVELSKILKYSDSQDRLGNHEISERIDSKLNELLFALEGNESSPLFEMLDNSTPHGCSSCGENQRVSSNNYDVPEIYEKLNDDGLLKSTDYYGAEFGDPFENQDDLSDKEILKSLLEEWRMYNEFLAENKINPESSPKEIRKIKDYLKHLKKEIGRYSLK